MNNYEDLETRVTELESKVNTKLGWTEVIGFVFFFLIGAFVVQLF